MPKDCILLVYFADHQVWYAAHWDHIFHYVSASTVEDAVARYRDQFPDDHLPFVMTYFEFTY